MLRKELHLEELGEIPFDEKEILRYAMLPSFAPAPEELPLKECLEAAKLLSKEGIEARVINASSVCPLDEKCIQHLVKKNIPVCTVEEHYLSGGFGSAVAQYCAKNHLTAPAAMIGIPDAFVPHGSRKLLLQRYGLDAEGIARQVKKAVKQ